MKTGTGTNRTLRSEDTTVEWSVEMDADMAELMVLADDCEEDLEKRYPGAELDN